jgi:hypothetical protein
MKIGQSRAKTKNRAKTHKVFLDKKGSILEKENCPFEKKFNFGERNCPSEKSSILEKERFNFGERHLVNK